jgi:diacylglycerol kinase
MAALHTSANAIYLMLILVAAFLTILFLRSGIDKIVDRRGNLEWLKGHFAKSPLAGTVPALLTAITILDLAASAERAWLRASSSFARFHGCPLGAVISASAITALFFGQRIAKDYAGAAVLVPYFLLALIAIYLLAQG